MENDLFIQFIDILRWYWHPGFWDMLMDYLASYPG